jgi:hypothetical protein
MTEATAASVRCEATERWRKTTVKAGKTLLPVAFYFFLYASNLTL